MMLNKCPQAAQKSLLLRSTKIAHNSHRQQQQQHRQVATTSSSHHTQQLAATQRQHAQNKHQKDAIENQVPHSLASDKFKARIDHLSLWHSLDTIKRVGYRLAQLDPLSIKQPEQLADLTWSHALIEQMRSNSNIVPTRAFLATKQPLMGVNELVDCVWNIYANNSCGVEFAHMTNQVEVEWLTSNWEKLNETFHLHESDQMHLAKLMLECETFDHFMAAKFPAVKRYGCEGAEPMLVVLDEVLRLCQLGTSGEHTGGDGDDDNSLMQSIGLINDVIVGMPHRGRLNLLACLLGLEPAAIFSKARGEPELDVARAWMAHGDVLSHLSTNCRFVYGLDRHHIGLSRDSPAPINVSLLPNPSHLEVASPLAMGAARGRAHNLLHGYSSSPKFASTFERQEEGRQAVMNEMKGKRNDHEKSDDYTRHLATILPIQIHGDAALAGQGIMQETLQMSNLPAFTAGGSLHLVVNNQIGYTTEPTVGRSSRHCTDLFKLIEAPIVHVNGQNIASVVRATRLALAYRQTFHKDIVLNLVCYRQHGHNELDEPAFTQPLMYSNIRERDTIPQTYCNSLGVTHEKRKQICDDFKGKLQQAYKCCDRYKPDNDNYRNFTLPTEFHRDHVLSWKTGVDLQALHEIALASVRVPEEFRLHPNLKRVLVKERIDRFSVQPSDRVKVDWATAELLAFGSLLKQNHSVRLAGQDVARGTFSTRHAILYDQQTQKPLVPLNEMIKSNGDDVRARLEIANTILSEEAALAYEFGYSIETCELTLWEAQFGDFFNTAQSIIDTLVSSSESKWLKQSALTLLLPHGLDGAGPEHSSAHIERFLQMSSSSLSSVDTEARVNWSVCFPTQPSQYFHLLRRQVLRPFRKPLVVMSPKILFRHPECQSELKDFAPSESFQPILDDPSIQDKSRVDTIVLCSGKIYFTLNDLKRAEQMDNVALVRVEELCPFPVQMLVQTLKQYTNVVGNKSKLIWCQEEHKNQGAFNFVERRLANLANIKLDYIGREESELPATGNSVAHKRELAQIVKQFKALKR